MKMKEDIFKYLDIFLSKIKKSINEHRIFYLFHYSSKILLSNAKKNIREKGLLYFIHSSYKIFLNLNHFSTWINDYNKFWLWFYTNFKSTRRFKFHKKIYNYFYHKYNITWNNERSVEIPILWKIIENYNGKNILEVGNVLSYYFSVNYDIIDKYEKVEGVINQDVINYHPSKKYDLIISISTLEHVGWDETPREPMKILKAIENLKNLLTPNGKIVITLPLGQNTVLDKLIKENKIQFSKYFCLKRISKNNKWKEVSWDKISNAKYGIPYPAANGVIIGIIGKNNS